MKSSQIRDPESLAHPREIAIPPREQNPQLPQYIRVEEDARRRGFVQRDGQPNIRAYAAVLRRHGVTILGAGKHRMVAPAEVDAALAKVAREQAVNDDANHALSDAVAGFQRSSR